MADGKRPLDHARKITELAPDSVKVQFSPEVARRFARIEAAVHDSPVFDDALLDVVRHYAAGKPQSVERAFGDVAFVTQEVMKHVQATGDEKAKDAVDGLILQLLERSEGQEPVTLTQAKLRGAAKT